MSRSKPISFENRDKIISLGLNIAYYRRAKGLTQEQLSELAGITVNFLSEIETPSKIKPFSLEVLFSIADALKVEPYKLLIFHD